MKPAQVLRGILAAITLSASACARRSERPAFFAAAAVAINDRARPPARPIFQASETIALITDCYAAKNVSVEIYDRDAKTAIIAGKPADIPKGEYHYWIFKLQVGNYHAVSYINGKPAQSFDFAVVP